MANLTRQQFLDRLQSQPDATLTWPEGMQHLRHRATKVQHDSPIHMSYHLLVDAEELRTRLGNGSEPAICTTLISFPSKLAKDEYLRVIDATEMDETKSQCGLTNAFFDMKKANGVLGVVSSIQGEGARRIVQDDGSAANVWHATGCYLEPTIKPDAVAAAKSANLVTAQYITDLERGFFIFNPDVAISAKADNNAPGQNLWQSGQDIRQGVIQGIATYNTGDRRPTKPKNFFQKLPEHIQTPPEGRRRIWMGNRRGDEQRCLRESFEMILHVLDAAHNAAKNAHVRERLDPAAHGLPTFIDPTDWRRIRA